MTKEWYQYCKDCELEFGYSDFSFQTDLKKGNSRPERCPYHRKIHSDEIHSIACSHFNIRLRKDPPSILGLPFLGSVSHGKRELRSEERSADRTGLDFGINDENIFEVYDALKECQVVVIESPTGSGKSLYVPYRLIDPIPPYKKDCLTKHGPIVVTQPRILATKGIPDTIGKKLLGSSVGPGFDIGYRHGDRTGKAVGEHHDNRNRLLFVTDGTLLNWIRDGKIGDYSLVMIDEAHERSTNIDLIIGLMKHELRKYPHLKLIIASATIDTNSFVQFFSTGTTVRLLQFEGKRTYKYSLHWWTGPPIEYRDISTALAEKVLEILNKTQEGSILGFLPGEKDINYAIGILMSALKGRRDVEVYPAYAALGDDKLDQIRGTTNQEKQAGHGEFPRRIIIATNIAETSLTLPDVVYVVDSGYIKQAEWNSTTCRPELLPKLHSKDGCKQRWGRAGRVQNGEVFTLYSEEEYKKFPDHTPPEITRECLDDAILTGKVAGFTDMSSFSWIDRPQEKEINRALNSIKKRNLLDSDDDLTEHGLEIYRLSRVISRFLDKYDYNSTNRSLDVATLLKSADQYGCLIEAATVLAMMPRMGNSLYWGGHGLLIWDRRWSLESKDKIARVHNALKTGCRDDLDFACKLFTIYESSITKKSSSQLIPLKMWLRSYECILNIKNFIVVKNARDDLLRVFNKDITIQETRQIDFTLIPRLRLLMAIAWPDRIVEINQNKQTLFRSPQTEDLGLISRFSCGSWEKQQNAIVAMMDRSFGWINGKYQECPTANFLVEIPKTLPANEIADITNAIAKIRNEIKNEEIHQTIFADQLIPIGCKVEIENGVEGPQIIKINQLPEKFIPDFSKDVIDIQQDDQLNSSELYDHHQNIRIDNNTTEPILELNGTDNKSFDEKIYNNVIFDGNSAIMGEWEDTRRSNEAVVLSWEDRDKYRVPIIGPETEPSLLIAGEKSLEHEIEIKLVRPIYDLDVGSVAGFIVQDNQGRILPVSADEFSIALINPGLPHLEKKILKIPGASWDYTKPYLQNFLLKRAEEDLEILLNQDIVEGFIADITIDKNSNKIYAYIVITGRSGLVHICYTSIDGLENLLSEYPFGEKMVFRIKFRVHETESIGVLIEEGVKLSIREQEELKISGISTNGIELYCSKPLKIDKISILIDKYPKLKATIRKLYAYSNNLFIFDLQTMTMHTNFKNFYEEAYQIRENVTIIDPDITRNNIKELQTRKKTSPISGYSNYTLDQLLNESWNLSWILQEIKQKESWILQDINWIKGKILHLMSDIEKLNGYISTNWDPEKRTKYRQYIREHQTNIEGLEEKIKGYQEELYALQLQKEKL